MNATDRQPIRIVQDIAKPDIVESIITLLDGQLGLATALHYVSPLGILPDADEWTDCRHAVLLWASANGGKRTDSEHDGTRCINIGVRHIDGDGRDGVSTIVSLHVPEECEFDPKPRPSSDSVWSPAHKDRQ